MKNLFKRTVTMVLIIAICISSVGNSIVLAQENGHNSIGYINKQKANNTVSFVIRDTNDLAVLSEELYRFIAQNPNSTEEEQEIHLISFMRNGGLNQVSTMSIGDYVPGYNKLNSAERKLALQHPIQAIKVYLAGDTATSKTIEVYKTNGWKDNSDAFRHCLWNALMKQSIGSSAAEQWATAHEYDSSGLDKDMDLYNNKVGRSIYVSGKSLSDIVSAVKSRIRNGYCRRIVDDVLVPTNSDGM